MTEYQSQTATAQGTTYQYMHKLIFPCGNDGKSLEKRLQQTNQQGHDGHANDGSQGKLLTHCPEGNGEQNEVDKPHRDGGRYTESIKTKGRKTGNSSHHHLLRKNKGSISERVEQDAKSDEKIVLCLLPDNLFLFVCDNSVFHVLSDSYF